MIICFIGGIGSGKTLSAVAYARAHKKGKTVYSNIPLKFKHKIITAQYLNDWSKDKKQFNNVIMLLDEGYLLFDSRRSQRKKSIENTHFILQSRKKNVDILITAQSFRQLDVRVRDNVYYVIECKFLKDIKGLDYVVNKKYVIDSWGRFRLIKKYAICANAIYPLYDTSTIVLPDD